MDGEEYDYEKDVVLWIMISIIIVISIYLTIVYISLRFSIKNSKGDQKSIVIRSYPCYLNIILSLSLAINNLTRLIVTNKDKYAACATQAFILSTFDKLIGTTITMNSYLTYKGLCDYEYYIEHIKAFFIVTNIIGLVISIIFGIIFTARGIDNYGVCYVEGDSPKEIPDTVLTSILFSIYLYCTLKTILFLVKNIKELSLERENNKTFSMHFYRMLVSLVLCSAFFIVQILIINDSLFFGESYIDLTYITLCLIIDLFFTLNRTIIKQTLKCCKKGQDMDDNSQNFDYNEEEDSSNIKSLKSI
jgi:heme/copper-type cytochrome/quinol oxidase subunit 2